MNLSEAIRKRIAILLKEKGWKIWALCKETGVPCSTITTFMNGKTSLIKLDTLLHICEGFGVAKCAHKRHNDIRNKRGNDFAECAADNNTDSHINHVSAHCKRLKFV